MARTSSPVHVVAQIAGAAGGILSVGADCDGVVIRGAAILDHGGREDFSRAYFEAVRQAEAWAERHGAAVPP